MQVQVHVPVAAQLQVQLAQMGTEGLFHIPELDVVQPAVQMMSLLVAFDFEKWMVPLVHLYLLELADAPDVRIGL